MEPERHEVVVVGTRPEIVKMAPVVRALSDHPALEATLVHTEQHYDSELSDDFETLSVPEPDARLGVGSGSHEEQTADGLCEVGAELRERDGRIAVGDLQDLHGGTSQVTVVNVRTSGTLEGHGTAVTAVYRVDGSLGPGAERPVVDRTVLNPE